MWCVCVLLVGVVIENGAQSEGVSNRVEVTSTHANATRQVEVIRLSSKISSEVEDRLSSKQREYYLRQQLSTIKSQLGEADEDGAEVWSDDTIGVGGRDVWDH